MVMGPEGMEKGGELSMRVSREMRGSDVQEEGGRERKEGVRQWSWAPDA